MRLRLRDLRQPSLPLQDEILVRLDGILGFDWLRYNALVWGSTPLRALSGVVYNVALPFVFFTVVWLSLRGQIDRSGDFVFAIVLGAVICITVSWLVPAAGAVGYFAPDDSLYNGLPKVVDLEYKQNYFRLRAGEPFVVSFTKAKSLVAFPSYHVCMALLVIPAFRHESRWISVPILVVNLLTIASTPVDGRHHLTDAIGGAFIGLFCHWAPGSRIRSRAHRGTSDIDGRRAPSEPAGSGFFGLCGSSIVSTTSAASSNDRYGRCRTRRYRVRESRFRVYRVVGGADETRYRPRHPDHRRRFAGPVEEESLTLQSMKNEAPLHCRIATRTTRLRRVRAGAEHFTPERRRSSCGPLHRDGNVLIGRVPDRDLTVNHRKCNRERAVRTSANRREPCSR